MIKFRFYTSLDALNDLNLATEKIKILRIRAIALENVVDLQFVKYSSVQDHQSNELKNLSITTEITKNSIFGMNQYLQRLRFLNEEKIQMIKIVQLYDDDTSEEHFAKKLKTETNITVKDKPVEIDDDDDLILTQDQENLLSSIEANALIKTYSVCNESVNFKDALDLVS
jgi:hypothetical protein